MLEQRRIPTKVLTLGAVGSYTVNGGNSGHWVTPDSDSSCSESAAADGATEGKASPPPHAASLTGGGVGGGRFAAKTVAVRSYPLSGVPPIYLIYNHGEKHCYKLRRPNCRYCWFITRGRRETASNSRAPRRVQPRKCP